MCRRRLESDEQLEQRGMANVHETCAKRIMDEYINATKTELSIALRSAMRLGHADLLSRTHFLQLSFVYDPKPLELRKRFTFRMAVLFRTASSFRCSLPEPLRGARTSACKVCPRRAQGTAWMKMG